MKCPFKCPIKSKEDLLQPHVLIIILAVLLVLSYGLYSVLSGKNNIPVEEKYFQEAQTTETDYLTDDDKKLLTAFGLVSPQNVSQEAIEDVLKCFKKKLDQEKIKTIIDTGAVKFLDYEEGRTCIGEW
ncbi:MAG: hypothetical protein V1848_00835 [Candidatus Magasanikbacteria bacterium]